MVIETSPQIYRWLMDYALSTAWSEFKSCHTVDRTVDRDLIQAVIKNFCPLSDDGHLKRQLIILLCKLADGEEYHMQYEGECANTVLEDAVAIVELFDGDATRPHQEMFEEIKISVKEQAVFVCCRANDFTTASGVFSRVWKTASTEAEKLSKGAIAAILKDKEVNDELLVRSSYQGFLRNMVTFLDIIMPKDDKKPFLIQAAETVLRSSQPKADINMNISGSLLDMVTKRYKLEIDKTDRSVPMETNGESEEPLTNVRVDKPQHLKKSRRVKTNPRSQRIVSASSQSETEGERSPRQPHRRKRKASEERVRSSSASETEGEVSMEEEARTPTSPIGINGHRFRRNVNRENRHEPLPNENTARDNHVSPRSNLTNNNSRLVESGNDVSDDDGDVSSIIPKLRKQLDSMEIPKMRKSLMPPPPSEPNTPQKRGNTNTASLPANSPRASPSRSLGGRTRRPWSRDETERLYRGVVAEGVGSWREIQSTYNLGSRTNVQLKDRWRIIQKDAGLLSTLEMQYGRV